MDALVEQAEEECRTHASARRSVARTIGQWLTDTLPLRCWGGSLPGTKALPAGDGASVTRSTSQACLGAAWGFVLGCRRGVGRLGPPHEIGLASSLTFVDEAVAGGGTRPCLGLAWASSAEQLCLVVLSRGQRLLQSELLGSHVLGLDHGGLDGPRGARRARRRVGSLLTSGLLMQVGLLGDARRERVDHLVVELVRARGPASREVDLGLVGGGGVVGRPRGTRWCLLTLAHPVAQVLAQLVAASRSRPRPAKLRRSAAGLGFHLLDRDRNLGRLALESSAP